MTNQTFNGRKTLSLRERWNLVNPDAPRREKNRILFELKSLLCKEAEVGTNASFRDELTSNEKELLKEFRSTFTWRQSEWRVSGSYEIVGSYQHLISCKDLEELRSYLNSEKDFPNWDEVREKEGLTLRDYFDFDEDYISSPSDSSYGISADFYIYDLELKPETEPKKTFRINFVQSFEETLPFEGVDSAEAEALLRKQWEEDVPNAEVKIFSIEEVEVS